jgi:hypothetical protein
MKSFSIGCVATVSIALLVSACGGANVADNVFADPGADAAAGSDTQATGNDAPIGNNDGGNPKKDTGEPVEGDTAPPDTGAPLSADNVCSRLADAICTPALSSCCGTKGIEYKDSGCKSAVLKDCADKLTAVKDGKTTLNLDAYAGCVGAWSTLSTKCATPILEFVKTFAPCSQLFNGTTPFGNSCSEDYQCKVSAGAYGNCTTEGRCDSVTVVGKDAVCGTVSGNRAFCDYGLSCNYTSSSSGVCRTARAIGAACSQNYECGFGNYCSRSFGGSGSCAVGLASGASCSFPAQCASGSCSGGRCTDPNITLASPLFCNGSGG